MSDRALSLLIHGQSKVGKTTLANTAPYPRLLLDVEAASRFLRANKVYWDPMKGEPPVADGTWDTCVVRVNKFDTALEAYKWLQAGRHQFRSLILDSISELQAKAMESVAGRSQMQTQHWGELLRRMAFFCRDLRDLTTHPENPLEAVVITAMSRQADGVTSPYLQGQISSQIPYWFDVCGYLYTQQVPNQTTGEYETQRMLLTRDSPQFTAGERVQGMLAPIIQSPNIEQMLDAIFGPREEQTPAQPQEQAPAAS